MSVTHSWSGSSRANCRSTRSLAVGRFGDAPELRAAREALQAGTAHEQLNGVVTDDDAVTEGELGVHAPVAVGAAGVDVDLADEIGQPRVTDRSHWGRGRPIKRGDGSGVPSLDSIRQVTHPRFGGAYTTGDIVRHSCSSVFIDQGEMVQLMRGNR